MKTKLGTIILTVLLSVSLFAQTDSATKEQREVEPFNAITVGSGLDVYITQDTRQRVEVEAENDVIHRIITEVKGETLHIYVKGRFKWNFKQTRKIYVSVADLKSITANGGADVRGINEIKSELLSVSSNGGADIYLDVESRTLKLHCSGGADIKISGSTDQLTAQASGGGDINAKKLVAKYVDVSASGGGDITVYVTESLEASASGGGDVYYSGSPQNIQIHESSGGDVSGF